MQCLSYGTLAGKEFLHHALNLHKGALLAIAGSALVSTLTVGATFAPSTLAAFTDTAASSGNSVSAGTMQIDVVDNGGTVTSAARVSVANASPAMAVRQSSLSVRNSGSLAASLRVHAANLVTTGANLDDVLKVEVTDDAGAVVYSGKVATLDFQVLNVPANTTGIYTLKLTWPDDPTVDDNPYQGATMAFDLTADASVIAGQ